MTRNLKITVAAVMALAAVGVLGATGAQGAEFHCTPAAGQSGCTLTLEKDGTGKTAHHVFEITNKFGESSSITCETLAGHGTLSKTSNTLVFLITYHVCTWNGATAEVKMNGCQYKLNANSGKNLGITGCGGKQIEFLIPTCTAKVGEQESEGVTYHNIGTSPHRTITFSLLGTFAVTSVSGPNCGIKQEGPYTIHYQTGNTIIKGEEDPGAEEVDTWWQ